MVVAHRITERCVAKMHNIISVYLTVSQLMTWGLLGSWDIGAMFTEVWVCLTYSPLSPIR